jgi:hypothetical protein
MASDETNERIAKAPEHLVELVKLISGEYQQLAKERLARIQTELKQATAPALVRLRARPGSPLDHARQHFVLLGLLLIAGLAQEHGLAPVLSGVIRRRPKGPGAGDGFAFALTSFGGGQLIAVSGAGALLTTVVSVNLSQALQLVRRRP